MRFERVGPYEIVREIGRGGMGVVFEARDTKVGRAVALKVVAGGGSLLARFEREARLLAKVQHQGVLKIHAVGKLDEGEGAYLVTDLLTGQDLHHARVGASMAPRRAAELVRGVADAVACVHEQGILHRDLKPANVILEPDGRPILLDFGLARDDASEKLTKTGALVGTPSFMAPEQADAAHASLDERTDVYGLGAILFFLLAGRAPFEGGPAQVVVRVLSEDPRWPSSDDPQVPRDLEAICRRAMAKAREDRYPGAAALRDDLDRWLAGASPTGGLGRPRRLALAAALAAIALGLGAAGAVLSRPRGPSPAPPPPGPHAATQPPPPSPPSPGRPKPTTRVAEYRQHVARVAAARREGKLTPELSNGLARFARGPLAWLPFPKPPREDDERYETGVRFLDATRLLVRTNRSPELRVFDLEAAPPVPHVLARCSAAGDSRFGALAVAGEPAARQVYFGEGDRVERVVVDLTRPLPEPLDGVVVARLPLERTATEGSGHPDVVVLDVSPDGRFLGVGGHWTSVWVFDLAAPDRKPIELPGHAGDLRDVAFSSDGRKVATACRNPKAIDAGGATVETARLWSIEGKQELSLGHLFRSDSVVFRPGTNEIALAGAGATLTLAEPGASRPVVINAGRVGTALAGCQFTNLVFSPDGSRAISLARLEGRGFEWQVWDLKNPSRARTSELGTFNPTSTPSLAVSPDGALVAIATSDERGVAIFPLYETGDEVP